jgi:membrane fusion protein (multidrug efflux system)
VDADPHDFTKLAQRLPARIVVTPGQPLARLLRAGLAVDTIIHAGLEDVVDERRKSSDHVTGH